jgi:CheY-like chemotaxis protein
VELLSALGYQVFEAENAQAAVEVIDSGAKIDLVFSDVMMPGQMTSLELSKVVRAKLPSAQILFTSGYAEGVLTHDGRLDAGVNLLQKPYNADVLSARIRHLLRRRKPASVSAH